MSDPTNALPEPSSAPLFPKIEEEVLAYWKKHRVFERSVEERSESKRYTFYDGPPFATGLPHYGHLLQSAIKDVVPRYWAMKGFRVPRKWGWDCHGLPIENLIEQELKLGSKREIEEYGIDTFNDACRRSVLTYEKEWGKYIDRLGRWVDFAHPYKTMDNDYIESVWWVFSELWKKGLAYKGVRVSLYCPRCETPLSNFEIAMGDSYIEKEDPAIFIKFPVEGKPKTYFLAWTTTPWTVPAITGLAIHPDAMYTAVKIDETGETLIFAEARQSDILKQYYPLPSGGVLFENVGRWKGSELIGWRFDPPYHFFPLEGDGNRVVSGSHVTTDVGTGIVTTAPAFGEEDLQVARESHLPVLFTVKNSGRMAPECGPFAGLKVQEADRPVIEDLKARHLLYREEAVKHSVPICWRCNTPLLRKAQPAWFVNITKLKPRLLKTAKKIHWHPEHFKEGRFGKGLETAPDWNISRTRYWGSPIPVWECASCHAQTIISSLAELKAKAKAGTLSEPINLHRPMMDEVIIPCACGGEQKRIPEVFDCWVESGAMPVASLHYPFENKKWFKRNFPADFIGEAQDQTRGWFYTLHVLATALFDKPAFIHAVVTGMMLAENGKKMSKKLKNYPDPWHIFTTYGADALRYYLLSSPVVEADFLNFSERDLQNILRGFLNLYWNVKTFYATYVGDTPRPSKPRSTHVLDRWLYARLAELVRTVTEEMDGYELARAARPLRAFVDDLSTWWLRRSRERIKSENAFERADALKTLREVLEISAMVMAPFIPFLADRVYQDVGGKKMSVHLEKWPKPEKRWLDTGLIEDMAWLRQAVSLAHEARAAAKIAVRQALARVTVYMKDAHRLARFQRQTDFAVLIRDEVNVEAVEFASAAPEQIEPLSVDLDTRVTPELKRKGLVREFVRQVMQLRKTGGLRPIDRIALAVMVSDAEMREAVKAEQSAVLKEVKADQCDFVAKPPEASKATLETTLNGKESKLWLL